MTRRRIALLCLLAGALLAALMPWTLHSERIVSALARQIEQSYGVRLASNGQLSVTLLPMPQFVLNGVRLASADGAVEVEARELRSQLRLVPLLGARLRLYKVVFVGSRIAVRLDEEPSPTVAGSLNLVRARVGAQTASGSSPRIDRFLLTDSEIALRTRTGDEIARFKQVSLVLNSPESDADIDLTASVEWNGETAIVTLSGLNLAAIRDGRPRAIEGEITAPSLRLTLNGRLAWTEIPQYTGSVQARTPSLARFVRWSGLMADLAEIDRPGSIVSEGTVDTGAGQWTRAAIEIGRDRFEGALAVQFGSRPQIRATMAGDDLELGWIGRLVDPTGSDRARADYDVRLSANDLGFGSLHLRDAALSIQSSARAIEVSLGRAAYAGGTVRGRVVAALDGEGRDVRANGWADGVSLEKALGDLSRIRGISGTATGQFNVEIAGDRGEPPVGQLRGRSTFQAKQGEIGGPTFADAARRGSHGSIPPDWRSGRARFSEARATLDFANGRAELSDAMIESSGSRYRVAGRVDLATLNASLRLTGLTGNLQLAPVTVDLTGPLGSLSVNAAAEAPTRNP